MDTAAVLDELQRKAAEQRALANASKVRWEQDELQATAAERLVNDFRLLYLDDESPQVVVPEPTLPRTDGDQRNDLAGSRTVDAMYDVLSETPDQPMHAGELAAAMELRGWKSDSEQPRDTISVAYRRRSEADMQARPELRRLDRAGRARYVVHSAEAAAAAPEAADRPLLPPEEVSQ